jgi:hypothetical protein
MLLLLFFSGVTAAVLEEPRSICSPAVVAGGRDIASSCKTRANECNVFKHREDIASVMVLVVVAVAASRFL